jgi:hypothetical protein
MTTKTTTTTMTSRTMLGEMISSRSYEEPYRRRIRRP